MSSAAPTPIRRRSRGRSARPHMARGVLLRSAVIAAAIVVILAIQGSLILGLH